MSSSTTEAVAPVPVEAVPDATTPTGWGPRSEHMGPSVQLTEAYGVKSAEVVLSRPSGANEGAARLQALRNDVLEQVRAVMRPSAARRQRLRLGAQLADARRLVRSALARKNKITAEIAWVETDALPGCGQVIVDLERQAAEADREHQAAVAEVRVLEPKLEQASIAAQSELRAAFPSIYAASRAGLEGERDRTRGEIITAVAAAAGPLLDRLAELDSAVAGLEAPDMAVLDVMAVSREGQDGDDATADAAPAASVAAAAEPVTV